MLHFLGDLSFAMSPPTIWLPFSRKSFFRCQSQQYSMQIENLGAPAPPTARMKGRFMQVQVQILWSHR
jgi:hypothetical protein